MSGLVYTFSQSFTVTTTKSLLQLEAGAAPKRLEILRAWIHGQVVADEAFRWAIAEVTVDGSGTLGAITDIQQHNVGGVDTTVTLGATATMYNGTVGTSKPIIQGGASTLLGMEWLPTPEERIWVGPTKLIALQTLTTIASQTVTCGITFREHQ